MYAYFLYTCFLHYSLEKLSTSLSMSVEFFHSSILISEVEARFVTYFEREETEA